MAAASLDWLLARGITVDAIASPWAVQIRRVVFNADRFSDCPIGEPAFVLGILDDGLIDEAAWNPVTGEFATADGIGWALGQGQLERDGLGTHGRALPVRRGPLEWLQCNRTGIVIVDWQRAAHALAGAMIEGTDATHVSILKRRLAVPPPAVVVSRSARRMAA